jgi:hypothetical protein
MLLGNTRASVPDPDQPDLLDWDEAKDRVDWSGLLVGNGASIACWDDFNYLSIFERSREGDLDHSLEVVDVAVFDAFRTTNFEQVLASLKTARVVLSALGYDPGFLAERYESIQEALFDAVHSVHVPWGFVPTFETKLQAIRAELGNYDWVYSLNYDLILYWAITSVDRGAGFADFFWNLPGHTFDPANTVPMEFAEDWPRVVWLHGGIHLRRHIDGTAFKETADERANLLEKFKTPSAGDVTPLLVSEGTPEDKYRAITRSAYLDFALRSLSKHSGGLVIFGSSLRDEDKHLVRAINEQPIEDVAISIFPDGDDDAIVEQKAWMRFHFPHSNLYFFDSRTHPLGVRGVKFDWNVATVPRP